MVRRVTGAALAAMVLVSAPSARAGSPWDVPTVALEMRGAHDSELFPGSTLSTPDKGAEFTAEVETGRRLSKQVKVSLGVQAGAQFWSQFSEASYGWAGANATLRRGGTQFRADLEWTPSRLKFPAELEGGKFRRLETRLGVRQALGDRVRLRVEGRHQDDDFVTAYDTRDAAANEGYGLVVLRANERVSLRADVLVGRTATTSRKYAHVDQVVGGGANVTLGAWRLDAGVWSGLSRYREARSGDSNFRRRDQWMQVRTEVRRTLSPSLSVLAAGEWTDQISSRLARSYDRNTIQLGLAWTRVGE